jgi:hypothetical protein
MHLFKTGIQVVRRQNLAGDVRLTAAATSDCIYVACFWRLLPREQLFQPLAAVSVLVEVENWCSNCTSSATFLAV